MTNPLVKGSYANIFIPARVHIPAADGGHLVVVPGRRVLDTTELRFNEANELHLMKLIAKRILNEAFDEEIVRGGIGTFNYQENGNWSVHLPENQQHAHIHVYGRGRAAETQPFGKALDFSRFEKDPDFQGYPYWDGHIDMMLEAKNKVLMSSDIPAEIQTLNRRRPGSVGCSSGFSQFGPS